MKRIFTAALILSTVYVMSRAALITRTHTYTDGNTISASENNTNENTLYTEINGSLDAANIEDGTLTSGDIANDTILNADVNSAAAIAVSKLEVASDKQILRSSGSTPTWAYFGVVQSTMCRVEGSSTTAASGFVSTLVSCTITPKSTTSQIKIMATGSLVGATDGSSTYLTITRGSANLGPANGFSVFRSSPTVAYALRSVYSMQYLDSPLTASATTYNVYMKTDAGAQATINDVNSASIIILEELGI